MILMSSHMFEEVERTCDRTAIMAEGKLLPWRHGDTQKDKQKIFTVTLGSKAEAEAVSRRRAG